MKGMGKRMRASARALWHHRILSAALLVVCVFGAEFLLLTLPQAQAAYTIANSARFISGSGDYLNRTPGGAGDRVEPKLPRAALAII